MRQEWNKLDHGDELKKVWMDRLDQALDFRSELMNFRTQEEKPLCVTGEGDK